VFPGSSTELAAFHFPGCRFADEANVLTEQFASL